MPKIAGISILKIEADEPSFTSYQCFDCSNCNWIEGFGLYCSYLCPEIDFMGTCESKNQEFED